jgi:hypothetical protein
MIECLSEKKIITDAPEKSQKSGRLFSAGPARFLTLPVRRGFIRRKRLAIHIMRYDAAIVLYK